MKTNNFNLPDFITNVIDKYQPDEKKPVEHRYSITELLLPVKEIYLKRKYWDYIITDYSDCINTLFGSAFHSLFENTEDSYVHELKLEYTFNNVTIVGKIDLLDENNEEIIDFKTTSVNKVITNNFDENIKQCIAYAWLRKKIYNVYTQKIKLVYFMKDWKKMLVDVKQNYPSSPIYIYEKQLTTDDYINIESYLLNKIDMLENNNIPDCSNEEKWKNDKYALYKNSTDKKASKVVDNLDDVDKSQYEKIEFREGESLKCNKYCEVKMYCEQKK